MFDFNTMTNGEKKQLTIDIGTGYKMPVTMIKGSEIGPTVCITASIHSGEYIGVDAAIRLAKLIDPVNVKGNIIIIHCVNTSGFYHKTLSVVFEDKQNLNRDFPPTERNTVSDEIRFFLVEKLYPQIDYLFDLHSGSKNEELTSCLFLPVNSCNENTVKTAKNLALATNIPKIILSQNSKGFVGYAVYTGIPALLLERGDFGNCNESDISDYIHDLRLLLAYLDVYAYEHTAQTCDKKIYTKNTYISAEIDGLWYPKVKANEQIKKGDLLGIITDFFGNELQQIKAEHDGIVFYYTKDLSICKNDDLYAYGAQT